MQKVKEIEEADEDKNKYNVKVSDLVSTLNFY